MREKTEAASSEWACKLREKEKNEERERERENEKKGREAVRLVKKIHLEFLFSFLNADNEGYT